jgi:predicted DNA-binding transcriptional regulator YafY
MAARRSRKTPRSITVDRTARLHHFLNLLASGAQTRGNLTRRLGIDVRGFYRDLELLRLAGIAIAFESRRYSLAVPLKQAVNLLPFPDPGLTIGEAIAIARGRMLAHRKIKELIAAITRPKSSKQRKKA